MIIVAGKVQVRRGLGYELPGTPISLNPLAFGAGLDLGEIAFTEDEARVFVGHSPQPGDVNYQRTVYPYQNVEVLTENSPRIQELFNSFIIDQDSNDFFVPVSIPIGSSGSLNYPVNTLNPTIFNGVNVSVVVDYHAFTEGLNAVKQGTLRILGTAGNIVITDTDSIEGPAYVGQLTFSANYDGVSKYTLQCSNQTNSIVNLILRRIVVTGFNIVN
jgi:hypothetical protein